MKFVIDLDTLAILEAAASGKRGDATPFEVVFQKGGFTIQQPAGTIITFAAKPDGEFDSPALIFCDEFTRSATGTDAKYLGNPSMNGVALNALFNIDGNSSNDVSHVDLMAEFSWRVGAGEPVSSDTFVFRVKNDVWKGTEDTPMVLIDPFFYLTAPAISVTLWGSPNTSQIVITGSGIPDKINGMRLFPCSNDKWSSDGTTVVGQPFYERLYSAASLVLYTGEVWSRSSLTPGTFLPDVLPVNAGGSVGDVTATFVPYPAAYPGQLLHDGSDFYRWNAVTSQWDTLSL